MAGQVGRTAVPLEDRLKKRGKAAPLAPFRVLDLSDEKGFLCGRLLADMGADVILTEPPGGHPARSSGPFYQDVPDRERSLLWFAYNTSKRSITLNIEDPDGQSLLKRLAADAHFLVESYPPGYLDSLGLGYSSLRTVNPSLVMASVTPFGQTGPYRGYKATDIVAVATGGLLFLGGDETAPPVRVRPAQAYLHAATQAAVGALIAHYHRQRTGLGQHVDVSMQAAIAAGMGVGGMHQAWDLNRTVTPRAGIPYQRNPPLDYGPRGSELEPCKDGYMVAGRIRVSPPAILEWSSQEGVGTELLDHKWSAPDVAQLPEAERQEVLEAMRQLFMLHTRKELYHGAIQRRIMWHPVNTAQDLLENEQLQARGFFVPVEHPELGGSFLYPGAPFLCTEMECLPRHRAPRIGEHNEEVYCKELGFSAREMAAWKAQGAI